MSLKSYNDNIIFVFLLPILPFSPLYTSCTWSSVLCKLLFSHINLSYIIFNIFIPHFFCFFSTFIVTVLVGVILWSMNAFERGCSTQTLTFLSTFLLHQIPLLFNHHKYFSLVNTFPFPRGH